MNQIGVGDFVWRANELGVWRVVGLEERIFQAGDYLPLGRKIGDAAPPWAVLERVLDGEFQIPVSAARGRSPRRAGASITSLRRISRADLEDFARRVMELAPLLPA